MKRILLLSLFLLLPQKAFAEATIEEVILTTSFAGFYTAEAYDDYCNKTDPKSRYDMEKKENVNWHANMQILVARIGNLQHIKNPELKIEDAVKHLRASAHLIKTKALGLFKEKGCQSEEAATAAKALQFYTKFPPPFVSAMIDKQIKEKGGTITPPPKSKKQD